MLGLRRAKRPFGAYDSEGSRFQRGDIESIFRRSRHIGTDAQKKQRRVFQAGLSCETCERIHSRIEDKRCGR